MVFLSFPKTEPPDCTNIVCNLECPSDSKLVRRADNLNIDTIIANAVTNITRPLNEEIIEQSVMTREKRAIPLRFQRRRENIKITPGGYIRRRRRDLNDSMPSTTTTTTIIEQIDECCSSDRVQCKCDLTKCPDIQCAPNEYKRTMSPGTRTPGNCCPKIGCVAQKPTCFSHNLKRHYNMGDRWEEDPCTSCECSDTGEPHCQASVCKALNCEKQQIIPGQCCPVCDTSDSKFCQSDEYCDLHCRNGFERDPIMDCNICRCAKMISITTPASPGTIEPSADYDTKEITTTSTQIFDWSTDSNTNDYSPKFDDDDDDNNTSSTKPIAEDENWIYNLPMSSGIVLILIAFAAVVAVFCLTCRHFNHNKDKHHLNRKQNTPLILN